MTTPKEDFVKQVQKLCDFLGFVDDISNGLREVYLDRGYNTGGADEIIEADLGNVSMTKSDLDEAVVLIQQFMNFMDNQAVNSADYRKTVNKCRTLLPGYRVVI